MGKNTRGLKKTKRAAERGGRRGLSLAMISGGAGIGLGFGIVIGMRFADQITAMMQRRRGTGLHNLVRPTRSKNGLVARARAVYQG
jgi:hypothetical protein